MNIFYLHNNPKKCAKYHCDKHVVKMILEYAQILSTAHRIVDNIKYGKLYKATHINHPCTVWTRKSHKNYMWLYRLFEALLHEYTIRYDKTHACEKLKPLLWNAPMNIRRTKRITPRPICVSDVSKMDSVLKSYRAYYMNDKRHIASWKKRKVPSWYN